MRRIHPPPALLPLGGGLRVTSQGTALDSPCGARMAGDYTRHGFSDDPPAASSRCGAAAAHP